MAAMPDFEAHRRTHNERAMTEANADPVAAAKAAIDHVLNRVRDDPDMAWIMGHSESLRRLCVAYAALHGMSLEEVERAVKTPRFKGESRVEKLTREIEQLRAEHDPYTSEEP